MDSNQRSANFIVVTAHWAAHSLKFEKEPDEISATGGHRVLSPIDVNEVLYRLSHATSPFDVSTTYDYRLSHATMRFP